MLRSVEQAGFTQPNTGVQQALPHCCALSAVSSRVAPAVKQSCLCHAETCQVVPVELVLCRRA